MLTAEQRTRHKGLHEEVLRFTTIQRTTVVANFGETHRAVRVIDDLLIATREIIALLSRVEWNQSLDEQYVQQTVLLENLIVILTPLLS
ncbi:unnamed protein product [Caenorhabditis sp. 36 PRJEB53466]|nr:unnamed protein product [Caenorhabditis sp. 36 PRJEB53466]